MSGLTHTNPPSNENRNCWGCTPTQSENACKIIVALVIMVALAVLIVGVLGYYQKIDMDPFTAYAMMAIPGAPLACATIALVGWGIAFTIGGCCILGPEHVWSRMKECKSW